MFLLSSLLSSPHSQFPPLSPSPPPLLSSTHSSPFPSLNPLPFLSLPHSPTPLLLQVVRTTGLRALHGLFSSVAGPQGLTAQLNGQLISVSTVSSSLTPLSSHSSHPLLSLFLSSLPLPLFSWPPLHPFFFPSLTFSLLPLFLSLSLSPSRLSMTTNLVWLTPKCYKHG